MKKILKIASFILATIIVVVGCANAEAAETANSDRAQVDLILANDVAVANVPPVLTDFTVDEQAEQAVPEFMSFTGTVLEILPFVVIEPAQTDENDVWAVATYETVHSPIESFTSEDTNFMILLENENGDLVNFVVNETSLVIANIAVVPGMTVTGFYDTNLMIPLIFPPRYTAKALFADQTGDLFVGRFTQTSENVFTSMDECCVVEISTENVDIKFADGLPFENDLSELESRILAVVFDENVPEEYPWHLTQPKIYVLFERAVHPIHYFTEEELAALDIDIAAGIIEGGNVISADNNLGGGALQLSEEDLNMFWDSMFDPATVQILVDDVAIEAPTPIVNREIGMVMLPVAAVSQALGYNVVGEGADIVIGTGITFTVGVDSYFIGRTAPRQLFAAPELHDNVLFVPISFFHDILPHAAYVADGNIIIRRD
ncbi:MAG: hypothetical protein FWG64_03800 [Firmicutes bacterium]|nr:hypothetical protein [Bacillota bacterium]